MITQSYRPSVRVGVNLIAGRVLAPMLAMLVLVWCLCGCEESPPNGIKSVSTGDHVRLVSLSPAISRTLVDLEMEQWLVGRTPWCSSVDESIPVVGDLYDIDLESLIRLNPTHLLVQPPRDGVREDVTTIASERGWKILTWSLDDIDDIESLVRDLPGVLWAPEKQAAAHRRAAEILNDMAQVTSPSVQLPWTGSTLLLAATDPVLAYGRGSYLGDLMISFGMPNAVVAEGWPELSLEDVQRLNPAAIVVVTEAARAEEDPMKAIGPIHSLSIDAVRDGRVAILASADAELPSSAVRFVARDLHAALIELGTVAAESRD